MKQFIFYLFLLLSATSFSQSNTIEVAVDTSSIKIGEQLQYKIIVNEIDNVIIPRLQNLHSLEIVDSLKIDTLKNQLVKKYILTGFDSGAFYIPQQQIFIKNQAFYTDSLLIKVATVAIDTTKVKAFPIKAIKGEPLQFDDYKHVVFIILGILLIVITVLYFALNRSDTSETRTKESLLPPYQEALRNLTLLDQKLLWQNNKIKEYYSELSEIIRQYIERELYIPALETTTDGLIETLKDLELTNAIQTDQNTIKNLDRLLQQADLVKFAKSKPLDFEIEEHRRLSEYIINHLKPSTVDVSVATGQIEPVILVEKPMVKTPSIGLRLLLIIIIILTVIGMSYGFTKVILLSNVIKPLVTNVQ